MEPCPFFLPSELKASPYSGQFFLLIVVSVAVAMSNDSNY